MVSSLIDRATNEHLKGPDFTKIREISSICIRDAMKAKDAVKCIKRRMQHRNPKVQLLSLILLDTLVKNCGDVIHRNVIEKEILLEMLKIINRKPDYRVKEKILILIETWQDVLGGARAKRPQFYAAFLDLLHAGVTFPRRPEKPTPKITPPPQARPVTSIVSNEDQPKVTDISPKEDASPPLSSIEIQNAQAIVNVLEEMLNALEPKNKEALSKDVIVDLVKHCRAYKERVPQLVNSTSEEFLLRQGLALNDKLQLVLTKHKAIASGTPIPVPQVETSNPNSNSTVVKADAPLIDRDGSKLSDRFASNANESPVVANGQPSSPIKIDPEIDLLSFDDFPSSPTAENSLSIVPAGTPLIANSQNDLALMDMFSQVTDYRNRPVPNSMISQYEPSLYNPFFNGQITQPASPVYGKHMITNSSFPQTPWELAQLTNYAHQLNPPYHPAIQVTQVVITNSHSTSNHPGSQQVIVTQNSHPTSLYSPQMQISHTGFGHGSGYETNIGYGRINENRMSGLSLNDDSSVYSSPSIKSSMTTEDELFGDLIDRSKFKAGKAVTI